MSDRINYENELNHWNSGNDLSDAMMHINQIWLIAVCAQEVIRAHRIECEEFYYNDVEGTLSQFDRKQLKAVADTYNIPVSTKMGFAIIQQILSMITSVKPYPRFLSEDESLKDAAETYEKAFHATWYECKGNKQYSRAVLDSLNSGEGFIRIREASRFKESSTNVVIEWKPWKHWFCDPETRMETLEDAEYIFYADVLRKERAEALYGIKVPDGAEMTLMHGVADLASELANDYYAIDPWSSRARKYVWYRELYERKEVTVYIGSDDANELYGVVSSKKPTEITIPNPEYQKLQDQINNLVQQSNSNQTGGVQSQAGGEGQQLEADSSTDLADFGGNAESAQGTINQGQAQLADAQAAGQQATQLQQQLAKTPKTVKAYKMVREGGDPKKDTDVVTVTEFTKTKDIRIRKRVIVGNSIVEDSNLPSDSYPIIYFPFSWFNNPNRTFGMMHYIKDLVEAMNKYISMILYHLSIASFPRLFIPDTVVYEKNQLEKAYSEPGTPIIYHPDYQLQNGGMPSWQEPPQLNQMLQTMLEYFKEILEYVTGVSAVMMGQPDQSSQTMGGTQSLQNFGSQRIKLYARNLEESLQQLAYVTVQYLQAYIPRDKMIQYIDEKQNMNAFQVLDTKEDIKFKVRVDIVNSLPTTKQMFAQILGFIAQTAGDPNLTALVTQYMLQIADFPEADDMAKQMDIVKNLSQQMAQLQQQLKQSQSQNNSLMNTIAQKDAANQVQGAVASAQQNIAAQKAAQETQLNNTETGSPWVNQDQETPF